MVGGDGGHTLVQAVLVLLALGASADHAVELVHHAAAAAAGGGLGVRGAHGVDGLVLLSAGELVDEIHFGGWCLCLVGCVRWGWCLCASVGEIEMIVGKELSWSKEEIYKQDVFCDGLEGGVM